MIKIIRNPRPQPVQGAFKCPSSPMKCMNDACLSRGYMCHLYKGRRLEFWR